MVHGGLWKTKRIGAGVLQTPKWWLVDDYLWVFAWLDYCIFLYWGWSCHSQFSGNSNLSPNRASTNNGHWTAHNHHHSGHITNAGECKHPGCKKQSLWKCVDNHLTMPHLTGESSSSFDYGWFYIYIYIQWTMHIRSPCSRSIASNQLDHGTCASFKLVYKPMNYSFNYIQLP